MAHALAAPRASVPEIRAVMAFQFGSVGAVLGWMRWRSGSFSIERVANLLQCKQHLFRGRILATQRIFQTPSSAAEQQAIDRQADFELLTKRAESTARGEMCRSERNFGRPVAWRGQQSLAEDGRIPGLLRVDRQAESEFAQVVLADGEDSNSRYPIGPKLQGCERIHQQAYAANPLILCVSGWSFSVCERDSKMPVEPSSDGMERVR